MLPWNVPDRHAPESETSQGGMSSSDLEDVDGDNFLSGNRSSYEYSVNRRSERVHNSESSFLNITPIMQIFKGPVNIGR